MEFRGKYDEGKLIGFTLMPENDADVWFLQQKLVMKEHCAEEDCKLRNLEVE